MYYVHSTYVSCFHEIKCCFLTFWMVAFSDLEAEQEEPHEGCEAQTSQREAVGSLAPAVPASKPFESIGWLDNLGHIGILEKHFGTRHHVWQTRHPQALDSLCNHLKLLYIRTTIFVFSKFFKTKIFKVFQGL